MGAAHLGRISSDTAARIDDVKWSESCKIIKEGNSGSKVMGPFVQMMNKRPVPV